MNRFKFYAFKKKFFKIPVYGDSVARRAFFYRNYKLRFFDSSNHSARRRNWAAKKAGRLGLKNFVKKATSQILILDYFNFHKKIFKHPEPTRIYIRYISRSLKGWRFRDFRLNSNFSVEKRFSSKLTSVFEKKNATDYKPTFNFDTMKKKLNHLLKQFAINIDAEAVQHFASVSNLKTAKKDIGLKKLAVKNIFLNQPPFIAYPINDKKRTRKPAKKISMSKLSKLSSYSQLWFNDLLDNIVSLNTFLTSFFTLHQNPGFRLYQPTNFRLNFFKRTFHVIDFYFPQEELRNTSSIFSSYSKALPFFSSFFVDNGIKASDKKSLDFFQFGF